MSIENLCHVHFFSLEPTMYKKLQYKILQRIQGIKYLHGHYTQKANHLESVILCLEMALMQGRRISIFIKNSCNSYGISIFEESKFKLG